MIHLIKNILNKRKRRIERLKRLQYKIDLLECKVDSLDDKVSYYIKSIFTLSKRLERVEHSSIPTYSMKRMLRDKELNSK